jgi:hypothetical protein
LNERCHEQGAGHAIWPEARHGGTDDSHHGRHEIAEGGRINVVGALNKVPPDEQEHGHKRNADGSSVRRCAKLPDYHLKRQTDDEEQSGDSANKKIGADIPAPFTRKKAPQQGDPQDERSDHSRGLPEAPAPSTVVRFCVHLALSRLLTLCHKVTL